MWQTVLSCPPPESSTSLFQRHTCCLFLVTFPLCNPFAVGKENPLTKALKKHFKTQTFNKSFLYHTELFTGFVEGVQAAVYSVCDGDKSAEQGII